LAGTYHARMFKFVTSIEFEEFLRAYPRTQGRSR
jgi:hypothetical protein